MRIEFDLNGREVAYDVHPGETLMEVLRRTGTVSVKDGCGKGDCGSCAVLVDGRAVTSCLLFAAQAHGRVVRTTEGLSNGQGLHPLQQALLDAGAVQCGFCTPGVIMAALDLLDRHPDPTEDEVRAAVAGNLCRCTGYVKIVDGIRDAGVRLAAGAGQEDGDG